MADLKDSLKTFDPKEIERIIEQHKELGFREIWGDLSFSVGQTFAILRVESEGLIEGEWPENQPPGFFLVFSRGELLDLVKRSFGLWELSE